MKDSVQKDGIFSHSMAPNTGNHHHADGGIPVLYCYLRLSRPSRGAAATYALAKELIENGRVVPSPKGLVLDGGDEATVIDLSVS